MDRAGHKFFYFPFHKSPTHLLIKQLLPHLFSTSAASPASAKLGLRMTTLHEEPSTKNALVEEDSCSDPDYPEYETAEERQQRPRSTFRTRMTASKTLGSLTEIGGSVGKTSAAASASLAYTSAANAAIKHVVGTPSMSSSASSGYGSQVNYGV